VHLSGNAQQWILAALGDRIDNRKRDEEFILQTKIKKTELIFLLENLKVNLKATLAEVSEDQLHSEMIVQGLMSADFLLLFM
jgi:hypothetical protein